MHSIIYIHILREDGLPDMKSFQNAYVQPCGDQTFGNGNLRTMFPWSPDFGEAVKSESPVKKATVLRERCNDCKDL